METKKIEANFPDRDGFYKVVEIEVNDGRRSKIFYGYDEQDHLGAIGKLATVIFSDPYAPRSYGEGFAEIRTTEKRAEFSGTASLSNENGLSKSRLEDLAKQYSDWTIICR